MMNRYNKFIFIFIGLFLLCLIIYNRLLKVRIPREFAQIHLIIVYLMLISTTVLLIITLIHFYKNFFNTKEKTSKISQFIQKTMNKPYNPINIATNSLRELDILIKNNIPFYDMHHTYYEVILKKTAKNFFRNKKRILTIIFFFRILPNMILCFSILLDMFYTKKIYYFYKTLWVLILPLIIKYIIYSIKIFVQTNLEYLDNTLVLSVTKGTSEAERISVFEWQLLLLTEEGKDYICSNSFSEEIRQSFGDDIVSANYSLQYSVDFMQNLFHLDYDMAMYDLYLSRIEIPFNIFKYLLFLSFWLHIFFYKITIN